MKPKYLFKIVGDLIEPVEKYIAPFRSRLEYLGDGNKVWITVEKYVESKLRTIPENNYYWGVVIKILSDYTGYTPEETHEALKWKFLRYENVEAFPSVLTTTQLTTREFEIYLSRIRRWAAADFGVYIPLPNEVDYE